MNILRHRKVHARYLHEISYQQSEDLLFKTVIQKEIFHIVHQEPDHLAKMEQKVLLLALENKTNDDEKQLLSFDEFCKRVE